jgi:hypothetical protein
MSSKVMTSGWSEVVLSRVTIFLSSGRLSRTSSTRFMWSSVPTNTTFEPESEMMYSACFAVMVA